MTMAFQCFDCLRQPAYIFYYFSIQWILLRSVKYALTVLGKHNSNKAFEKNGIANLCQFLHFSPTYGMVYFSYHLEIKWMIPLFVPLSSYLQNKGI